jgi:hypothetical protein
MAADLVCIAIPSPPAGPRLASLVNLAQTRRVGAAGSQVYLNNQGMDAQFDEIEK